MNSIPVYFLLLHASGQADDADHAIHRNDPELADAWINQAVGIQRAVDEYHTNGGELTDGEVKALTRLKRLIEMANEKLPPRDEWPTNN